VGFYWSSGHPALPLEPKVTRTPWESGLALPLTVLNVSSAQTFLRALPESMWTKEEQERSNVVMTGRADNMEKFKPGVQGIVLIFSDQSGDRVFRFPYYDLFAPVLEPLLMEVGGMMGSDPVNASSGLLFVWGSSQVQLFRWCCGCIPRCVRPTHSLLLPFNIHAPVLLLLSAVATYSSTPHALMAPTPCPPPSPWTPHFLTPPRLGAGTP
jgi:hypothetical protein